MDALRQLADIFQTQATKAPPPTTTETATAASSPRVTTGEMTWTPAPRVTMIVTTGKASTEGANG